MEFQRIGDVRKVKEEIVLKSQYGTFKMRHSMCDEQKQITLCWVNINEDNVQLVQKSGSYDNRDKTAREMKQYNLWDRNVQMSFC